MENLQILSEQQFASRNRLRTEPQTIIVVENDQGESLEEGADLLDVEKAWYRVCKGGLIYKKILMEIPRRVVHLLDSNRLFPERN